MKKISLWILSVLLFSLIVLPLAAQKAPAKKSPPAEKKPTGEFIKAEEVQPVPEELKAGFESITAKDSKAFLNFIASDALEGRDTGSRGYAAAAEFAATMFKVWGLKPGGDLPTSPSRSSFFRRHGKKKQKKERTYFQEIPLKERVAADSKILVESRKAGLYKSQTFFPELDYDYSPREAKSFSAPVVFGGYGVTEKGLKYDDYKNLDVKGKIVLILDGVPGGKNPNSPFNKPEIKKKYAAPRRSMRMALPEKAKTLAKKGAYAVLMVESPTRPVAQGKLRDLKVNDEKRIYPGERKRISLLEGRPRMPFERIPTITISAKMAKEIMQVAGKDLEKLQASIDKTFKPAACTLPGVSLKLESTVKEKILSCRNVVGYIEGSDPKLKDEVVVVGAHLDHLGKRGDYIFNGADDNGSGSVGVMELARAFAINKVKPKRTMIFCLWTGEEKGLLGSVHYVMHPVFPLEKTAAYINMDMISHKYEMRVIKMLFKYRNITLPKEVEEAKDLNFFPISFPTGREGDFGKSLKEANKHVGFDLFLYPSKFPSGGSDHMPFAFKQVPWVSIHTSMTEDYHQSSDSIDKTDPEMMENVLRLVYLSMFSIANQ